MLCGKMVTVAYGSVPCGQCLSCRINTRRKRAGRLILESKVHRVASFVTLTYDEDHVPVELGTDGVPFATLKKEDFTSWIRSVRYRLGAGVRFAGVGEYGDESGRPHYHAVLYGVAPGEAATWLPESWKKCDPRLIEVSPLIPERAEYLAKYTVKKMTKSDDNRLVPGQEPEFYRQSLRPAVGCNRAVINYLAELHKGRGGADLVGRTNDVANGVRIGGRIWPLDRTVRKHLRIALGLTQVVDRDEFRANRLRDNPPTEDEKRDATDRLAKTERRFAKRTPRQI